MTYTSSLYMAGASALAAVSETERTSTFRLRWPKATSMMSPGLTSEPALAVEAHAAAVAGLVGHGAALYEPGYLQIFVEPHISAS